MSDAREHASQLGDDDKTPYELPSDRAIVRLQRIVEWARSQRIAIHRVRVGPCEIEMTDLGLAPPSGPADAPESEGAPDSAYEAYAKRFGIRVPGEE